MMNTCHSGRFKYLSMALLMLWVAISIWGCSDDRTQSVWVETDEMYADMEITARGDNSAEVVVHLQDDDLDVELSDDSDKLVARADGKKQNLRKSGRKYITTFYDLHGGTNIKISFYRDGKEDALDSHVRLPQSFSITAPANHHVVTVDTEVIVFNWTPTDDDDPMWLETTYSCQKTADAGGSDSTDGQGQRFSLTNEDGNAKYTLNDLLEVADVSETYDLGCNKITVRIYRERFGEVDDAFGNGDIIAQMERELEMTFKP